MSSELPVTALYLAMRVDGPYGMWTIQRLVHTTGPLEHSS